MSQTHSFTAVDVLHNSTSYTIRRATVTDIPFLAWMQYEASLPPHNFSFWDAPLYDFGIEGKTFIDTVLKLDAGAWGSVETFYILEEGGKPLAAAAAIEASEEFAEGPVRVSCIKAIGEALGWTQEQTDTYRQRYQENWPNPDGNFILMPQAPYIIESVGVIPEARGRGLGKRLMHSLIDEGRKRGFDSIGISVANGNDPARALYEKLGFQMYVGFGPAFFGREGFPGYTKYKLFLD